METIQGCDPGGLDLSRGGCEEEKGGHGRTQLWSGCGQRRGGVVQNNTGPDEGEEPSQMRKGEMGALPGAASLVGTREAWERSSCPGPAK